LFGVGGIVAYLHEDEQKSFKLFELGIAAPALITSLITAQGISANYQTEQSVSELSFQWSIISSAQAETFDQREPPIIVSWGVQDVLDGVTGRAYKKMTKPVEKTAKSPQGYQKVTVAPRSPQLSARQDKKITETKKAKLQARLARLKARVQEKKYQASLAEAQAAEAIAESNEIELELMQRPK
jgi:hypothetical protein